MTAVPEDEEQGSGSPSVPHRSSCPGRSGHKEIRSQRWSRRKPESQLAKPIQSTVSGAGGWSDSTVRGVLALHVPHSQLPIYSLERHQD